MGRVLGVGKCLPLFLKLYGSSFFLPLQNLLHLMAPSSEGAMRMAVAYMKAFIECDTDAALDAANIDAIKDMLWYYSGDDYSYSEFEDMWSSIEYDKGKVVSVKVSISGSSDSSSNTFDVPVMYFDGQRTTPSR